jgi:hypothetical protein
MNTANLQLKGIVLDSLLEALKSKGVLNQQEIDDALLEAETMACAEGSTGRTQQVECRSDSVPHSVLARSQVHHSACCRKGQQKPIDYIKGSAANACVAMGRDRRLQTASDEANTEIERLKTDQQTTPIPTPAGNSLSAPPSQ